MSEHTSTPWQTASGWDAFKVYAKDGTQIVTCSGYEPTCYSNADFIVMACNAHEALVAALRSVLSSWVNGREVRAGIPLKVIIEANAAIALTEVEP